jgi:hypothetical protein
MAGSYDISPEHIRVLTDWYNRGASPQQISALQNILVAGGKMPDMNSVQSYFPNTYGGSEVRPANDPNARPSLYIPGIDNAATKPPPDGTPPKPKPPPNGRPPPNSNGPPPSINPANNAMLSGPNPIITSPFRHLFTQGQVDAYGLHTPMVISNVDAAGKIHSRDYNWWDPNAVLNTLVKPPPKEKGKK